MGYEVEVVGRTGQKSMGLAWLDHEQVACLQRHCSVLYPYLRRAPSYHVHFGQARMQVRFIYPCTCITDGNSE